MTDTITQAEVRVTAGHLEQHMRWKLAQKRLGMTPPRHAPIVLPDEEGAEEPIPDEPVWGAPINLLGPASSLTIIRLVALRYGIPTSELRGPSRVRRLVAARDRAVGLIWTHCAAMSLPKLGRLFGGRDHTTMLHTLRKLRLFGVPAYRRPPRTQQEHCAEPALLRTSHVEAEYIGDRFTLEGRST